MGTVRRGQVFSVTAQLNNRDTDPFPHSPALSELSSAAQADPVTTLSPVTGCTAPLNDVCFAAVGGDFTVAVRRFYPPANNANMLPDFQRAWCCGRALATTDAIGGNWRERDHAFTPEPIQVGEVSIPTRSPKVLPSPRIPDEPHLNLASIPPQHRACHRTFLSTRWRVGRATCSSSR